MILSDLDLETEIIKLIRAERKRNDDQSNEYEQLIQQLKSENYALSQDNVLLRSAMERCANCKDMVEGSRRLKKPERSVLDSLNPHSRMMSSQKRHVQCLMLTQYSDDDDDDESGTIILSSPLKPIRQSANHLAQNRFSPFKLPPPPANDSHPIMVSSPIAGPNGEFELESQARDGPSTTFIRRASVSHENQSPINDGGLDLIKAGPDSQRSEVRLLESEFGPPQVQEDFHSNLVSDLEGDRRDRGRTAYTEVKIATVSPEKPRGQSMEGGSVKPSGHSMMDGSEKSRGESMIDFSKKSRGRLSTDKSEPLRGENPDSDENRSNICGIIENLESEEIITMKPLSVLQNRHNTRQRLLTALHQTQTIINLERNPITENHWIITDFKRNPHYVASKSARTSAGAQGPSGFTKRRTAMTKEEEANQKRFYRLANGVGNDMASLKKECEETMEDSDAENFEQVWSQIHEKLPSPPGFMQSEFPDTQETHRRRTLVMARQRRRIKRRIGQCILVKMDIQCGEFIFSEEVLNAYVLAGRYT